MPSPLSRLFGVYASDKQEDEADERDEVRPTELADHEVSVERDRY